ncbi:DUF3081 family protein [Motilimonas cestriensis]|uniref:DUF3081 family protein n=1 Tax=Motilimonas cestriensis TaxID=2742685 RepID=UPI003DA5A133
MKNEICSKTILTVFEYIQQHGEDNSQGKLCSGILAFTDFDCYTLYLQGSGVTMRFGFHNSYHLDYEQQSQKNDFLKKINLIYNQAIKRHS